jgi:hypothetical protein
MTSMDSRRLESYTSLLNGGCAFDGTWPFDRYLFREWLLSSTDLGPRSVSDVCSRLGRLSTMIDLNQVRSNRELCIALLQSDLFEQQSKSIRSQLKRSAMLYLQFLQFLQHREKQNVK